jgi:hypothetical protein
MTEKGKHVLVLLLFMVPATLFIGSCARRGEPRFRDVEQYRPERQITHMEMIRAYGALKVVTEYNSISYFLYRATILKRTSMICRRVLWI